jgi:hypothetical protein
MEPKVLQVLPDLKDQLALQVWREQMEQQVLRVLLAQRVLKDLQVLKGIRD